MLLGVLFLYVRCLRVKKFLRVILNDPHYYFKFGLFRLSEATVQRLHIHRLYRSEKEQTTPNNFLSF